MHLWIKRVAVAVISVSIAAATGEFLAARHLGKRFVRGGALADSWRAVGRPDPEIGWSGRPNGRVRVQNQGIDYAIHLNSFGFRDIERPTAKPAGTKRVIAIGDSVTFGWGVSEGERFSDMLDADLGPDVEVLNMGCPGYGTDQAYWTLSERALAFEPDAVLLCMVINDTLEVERRKSYGMPKPVYLRREDGTWELEGRPVEWEAPAPPTWSQRAMRNSALLSWAAGRVPAWSRDELVAKEHVFTQPPPEFIANVRGLSERLVDPNSAVRHSLELVRAFCLEKDIALLVTCAPNGHDQYIYEPRHPLPDDLGPAPFRTYFSTCIARACEELDVPFVTADDALLEACRAGATLHVGDGHPNAASNRILAKRLVEPLRELLAR
jgi:hypothetical protein